MLILKDIKYFMILGVLVVTFGIVAYISYVIINQENIIKDGDVFEGTVRIENTQYVYTDCEILGKTKKIAEIDNWDVYEISEDSKQIFLKMNSIIGEQYTVREDYQIPTSGKVNCAYIEGKRVEDEWCRVVYHEVDEEYAEAFEDSKIWMR